MAALKRKKRNIMTEDFLLKENPFSAVDIYNIDQKQTYVPEVFGEQLDQFYEKFFLSPMENETHKQIIGAIWSTHSGGKWGKGFGKSILMAEESKLINADLGRAMLERMQVEEPDIAENPVLSGYCSFDQSKGINSFPSTLLEAVAFILDNPCFHSNVHQELRSRICTRIGAEDGYEAESIQQELLKTLRQYKSLTIQLTHHTVRGFIYRLCHDDTEDLVDFIRNEIGPRIRALQGFNFIHVFNAFASLAGIVYVVYFIDQVENFSRFARNKERDIKIIRESMCQTSPTADMASFIYQMHIHAQEEIEDWWALEDLPSIIVDDPSNKARIVNLKGLGKKTAKTLVATYLKTYRVDGTQPPDELHPFSREIVDAVRDSVDGNPRSLLRKLGEILNNAKLEQIRDINLAYVSPLLEADYQDQGIDDEDEEVDEFENPER